jgi:hypothetical protein
MKVLWTILVAIVIAVIGKSIGRMHAKNNLTDDTSAVLTHAAHRASLRRVGRVAICAFLATLLMIVLSSFIARWIKVVGLVPFVIMNCCLALLAGTSASLGRLLERPRKWQAIQDHIEQRERLIEYLKRFLPIIAFIVLTAFGSARAADDCFFGDDVTPSMSASDQRDAKTFLKATASAAVASFGCKHAVAVAMGCDVRFAKRIWMEVPADIPDIDCSKAEAEPLTGHSSFWDFVRGISEARKEEAVRRCEEDKAARARKHEADIATFGDSLDAAFSASGPQRCSRITDSIRDALNSGIYGTIVFVSDAIDNPPTTLNGIVVPTGSRVILILARPNPAFARVEDSLARAAAWARIPGVTVVTTAELRPDLWRSLATAGSR